MIAMQYSFTFPSDYDMALIDRRIAGKGHLIDGFPGLKFKAYLSGRKTSGLSARKTSDYGGPRENLYAPFYVWDNNDGMNEFLCGPGFAGLVDAFGWPSVKTWSIWGMSLSKALPRARLATREIVTGTAL